MTISVGVHEAKTHLSRLLQQVADGDDVEITNRGRVMARLVGPEPDGPRFDTDRGRIWVADDFDAPLPEEILQDFEG